ncbi:DUF4007 family protein [Olsenella uli]|uniref:DUF4007 family protein n=1 Tax=Olsenella uli TaxID=133926 RepID=UPI0024A85050|nr:DUF4007 family protein [Olsenella uli]
MRFKAHQSFFVRKGWISKGLKAVLEDGSILMPSSSKKAMDELGLGANQVVALRYWLQAMGLITSKVGRRREHVPTKLGEIILRQDPYTEETGTLFAIQCNLASAREDAAAWYFFFNEFRMNVFRREDFTRALERYIFTYNDRKDVALASLESDFNCIVGTYVSHDHTSSKAISPESVIDCPLGELGLIDVESRADRTYRKTPPNINALPAILVLYAICSMQEHLAGEGQPVQDEVPLEALLNGPCSPGRVFNLDSVGLLDKLYELQNSDYLRINRTAGLDVVHILADGLAKEECLRRYYELMGQEGRNES